MIDSGVFELKTAAQLLDKLRRDLDHVRAEPVDSDRWFNFLVTADHLVEWYCAEKLPAWDPAANDTAAKAMRETEPLLRICHYLSINAKHFKAKAPKQKQGQLPKEPPVASTNVSHIVLLDIGGPRQSPTTTRPEYHVELSGREAAELQRGELSALELAGLLVRFWREKLDRTVPPRPPDPLDGMDLSLLNDENAGPRPPSGKPLP